MWAANVTQKEITWPDPVWEALYCEHTKIDRHRVISSCVGVVLVATTLYDYGEYSKCLALALEKGLNSNRWILRLRSKVNRATCIYFEISKMSAMNIRLFTPHDTDNICGSIDVAEMYSMIIPHRSLGKNRVLCCYLRSQILRLRHTLWASSSHHKSLSWCRYV